MTDQDPSNGQPRPQSLLSEAVEQGADAVAKWHKDIAELLEQQADRLSSGDYGLNDLVTAPVRLLSIWVKDAIDTAFTISDNLALLANPRSGEPQRPRTIRVPVTIPANSHVKFVASDTLGQLGYSIPSSDFDITQEIRGNNPEEINVIVTVKSSSVPNDTYSGILRADDPAIKEVPFGFAIDELGEPAR